MEQLNKKWITWFNKNKTKEIYDKILKDKFEHSNRCRICDGPIYYYDSTFSINRNGEIRPIKKSFLSSKNLYGKEYHLNVCEDCLTIKYPEYQNMNKSRVFNKMSDITEYAFDIPKDVADKFKKENYRVTRDNFIKKYGEIKGEEKWNSYKSKQAFTNTFDYKSQKYNWTVDRFNDYNKSRSVTLSNLIDTLDHFVKKFGKEKGEELYINKIHNNFYIPSKISGEIFDRLNLILGKKYKTYYYKKDGFEFGKLLSNGRYVFLDYYISDIKVCIEYYGDIWHANPKKFNFNDVPFSFKGNKKTAQEIWNDDNERIRLLKEDFDIDTIVMWESDEISVQDILQKIIEIENDKRN